MTLALDALFDPGLIDRLQAQYRDVDVHALAANVRDMARRKTVRNPSGMLVSQVRKAAERSTGADRDELERYARFHAALYRDCVRLQLGPGDVAERLETARADGFGRLNPCVVEALRELGDTWPAEAMPCSS